MILILLVFQFTVPVILIVWIALKPQSNLVGFWIQVFATGLALVLGSLIGIWLFPPWWMFYVYCLLLVLATYLGLRNRRPFMDTFPDKIKGLIILTVFTVLCGYCVNEIIRSLSGRIPPEIKMIELSFPLERGSYIVANGGNDLRINSHMKTMDTTVKRYRSWRGNAYGLDLVKINKFGFRSGGLQPSDPGKYFIYGTKVFAPCSGKIIAACNNLPDMQVPEIDKGNLAGNYVFLRGPKADVLMAHFKQGSLKVKVGEIVKAGQLIGEVGNSGVSNEPHLHIHAQRPGTFDAPFSGDPLPLTFDGRFLTRNDRWQRNN